jgi:pimeloyl-ACP methyl ester carboxylesterase
MAWSDAPRLGAVRCPAGAGTAVLRWTEWGPPEGEPVLCVHGLTRSGRDFDTLARALAAEGRRVICPDVFGRGMSDWLPDPALYAVPVYAQAMAPLLAGLGRRCDWVGTSMGGMIGMALCAIPEVAPRRMVLNDIGPFIPGAALARIGAYLALDLEFASVAMFEAHLRAVHAPFGPLTDEQWRHLALTSARMTSRGRIVPHYDPAISAPFAQVTGADIDLWEMWPAVAQRPLLVLRGEASDILDAPTAGRMGEAVGVALETIAGVGHAPALMDPAQIALVRGFLRG